MLREACSSWAVMSSREKLEAIGRLWPPPARTVPAGEAWLLLHALPPLLPPPACRALAERPCAARWRDFRSVGRPEEEEEEEKEEEDEEDEEEGLPMVLSSCSIEHRSAMRASRSTGSPWFMASVEEKQGDGFAHKHNLHSDVCI